VPLLELGKARRLSQEQLAKELQTTQGEISKIEHRADMYLSTLRNYVEAMNGELEIIARFKDGAVPISTFEELNNA
jgi:transcriptional regulator with XRE-family HTH domain